MKPVIGLIFGGPGPEHSISCLSAQTIWQSLNPQKYSRLAIGWGKDHQFYASKNFEDLVTLDADPRKIAVTSTSQALTCLLELKLDLVFPIVHGHGGEDGHLQGMLEVLQIPYVGAPPRACANAWHKGICKTLLKATGIPVTPWVSLKREKNFHQDLETLIYPRYVKPAASGSSVGVSRVTQEADLFEALEIAWIEDKEVLIEPEIKGREFECALLNSQPSPVGEIIRHTDFYDYEAKYLHQHQATPTTDPQIPESLSKKTQQLACQAAQVIGCEMFCRVDFFWEESSDRLYINEINTHPGFTSISMYPQLWEKAGLSSQTLIDKLIKP